jgi:hypothetical protein
MNSMDVSGMVGFPNKRLPQINDTPRGLFRRVLPYRTQGLISPLYKTCADTCSQNTCSTG